MRYPTTSCFLLLLELQSQLDDHDIQSLYLLFKRLVVVLMPTQYHGHFLDLPAEVDDLACEGLLAFALELEHGAEAAHVLVDPGELLGQSELEELYLFEFLHLLVRDLLQVCLQLFYLLLLGVHVPRVVSVAVSQLLQLQVLRFEGVFRGFQLVFHLDDVQLLVLAHCFSVLLLEDLVVEVGLFDLSS